MKTRLLILMVVAAVTVSILLPAVCRAGEGGVDRLNQVLSAVVDAYGGKDAVGKVQSVIAKGTIQDFVKRTQGGYVRYYAKPRKLRIEIMPEQDGEVRILNGNRGWRGGASDLKEVGSAPLHAMIYQYTYLDLPMGLIDSTYAVTYEGSKEVRGRRVNLVTIEPKGAPKVRVYLDPEKNLIVRAASDFTMGKGASELSTEYEDYRPVGKVLFPFRLVNYAGEMLLSVITLSDIQVNADIPQSKFAPGSAVAP